MRLFGRPHAAFAGTGELKFTRTSQTLLAYLLLQRTFCPRDVLASLCWGEQPEARARSCLNTALWRLRALVEPGADLKGAYLVTTSAGDISFNWDSEFWLDLADFQAVTSAALARPAETLVATHVSELERVLGLYTGDLLDGFYDDWALRERERLREQYLSALLHLMRFYAARREHSLAIAAGQRILSHDPLREDVHRDLMRLYIAAGQRGLAVRQYQTCRESLGSELGISPMEETEACYRELLQSRAPIPDGHEPSLTAALAQLQAARQQLIAAQEQLAAAVTLVERIVPAGSAPRRLAR